MASKPNTTRSLWLRALGCLAVVAVLAFCIITGGIYWLYTSWTTQPEWWVRSESTMAELDITELDQMAQSVEKRVFNEVSSPTEQPTRKVVISMDEATAWLRQRLPQWLENTGQPLPPEFEQPMMAVDGDLLVVAFYHRDIDQVISILFDARINDEEMLVLQMQQVRAGSLSIPVETFVSMLDQQGANAPEGARENTQELMEGFEMSPVFQLPGNSNRLVRVTEINLLEDAVELTVEPVGPDRPGEPAPDAAASEVPAESEAPAPSE